MKYFLAPRSNETAYKDNASTIDNGVSLEQVAPDLLPAGYDILSKREVIYAWGNRHGTKAAWERLEVGDTILFYAKQQLVSMARVIYKQHSAELALKLWPADAEGNAWEYTYFVDEPIKLNLPWFVFREASGDGSPQLMGFRELSEKYAVNIETKYGSLEKFFNGFKSGVPVYIQGEKTIPQYVNLDPDVIPEVITEIRNAPEGLKLSDVKKKARKPINFEDRHAQSGRNGAFGEKIVLRYEQRRLTEAGFPDLAKEVKQISLDDMTAGYDILSFEVDGTERKIEVKSTTKSSQSAPPINVSINEYVTMSEGVNYYLYLVFDVTKKQPEVFIIPNPFKKLEQFELMPSGYLARYIG